MIGPDRIVELLKPYLMPVGSADCPSVVAESGEMSVSLDSLRVLSQDLQRLLTLIVQWNAKMNLTSIRDPEEVVTRHFGESLFLGLRLQGVRSLLDLGSGSGFPGIPIQLLHPEIHVTLAESQRKKATFLREAVRQLGLGCAVWEAHVEEPTKWFDTVTLRAVDKMETAMATVRRMKPQNIYVLGSMNSSPLGLSPEVSTRGYALIEDWKVPQSSQRRLFHLRATCST